MIVGIFEILTDIFYQILGIRWQDIADIFIVSIVVYQLMKLLRETRVYQMLRGLGVFIVLAFAARWWQFYTLSWILTNLMTVWLVAFVMIFQPEIRQALMELGRTRFFGVFFHGEEDSFHKITLAVQMLVKRKIGALIVIERSQSLKRFIDTGIILDSELSPELLCSLFSPKTPLHDGAVIIREGRVVAAGCILPLSQSTVLSKIYGTRHLAAIGLTEETDGVVVVISEETHEISLTTSGRITPSVDIQTLEEMLTLYAPKRE